MITAKTKIVSIAALGIVSLSVAHAKDGFSVGVNSSNGSFSHTIERNTGTNLTPSITTRTEETDFGVGISAGYKFHIADRAYLDAAIFYQEQDIETRNINNLLITELTLNNTYGIKLKSGFDVTDNFSIYGLIGQTTLDFDINNSYTFAPPLRSASIDVDEVTIGAGVEFAYNDHWSIVGEYTQLNDVSFDPIPEVAVPGQINGNEVDYSALAFGINYRF